MFFNRNNRYKVIFLLCAAPSKAKDTSEQMNSMVRTTEFVYCQMSKVTFRRNSEPIGLLTERHNEHSLFSLRQSNLTFCAALKQCCIAFQHTVNY